MQDVKVKIFEIINATGRFGRVTSRFPKDFSLLPCAVIEGSRTPLMYADDKPYLWGYRCTIDIYAKTAEEAAELTDTVEEAMADLGLWPDSVTEAPQDDVFKMRLAFSIGE